MALETVVGLVSAGGGLIKGKGTPFSTVYSKLPKFFYQYAENFLTKDRKTAPEVFDLKTGKHITSMDTVNSIMAANNAALLEKAARRAGERVTGDYNLFTATEPLANYRGVVNVSGIAYDKNKVSAPSIPVGEVPVNIAPQSDGGIVIPQPTPQAEIAPMNADGNGYVARIAARVGTSENNIYLAAGVLLFILFRHEIIRFVRSFTK